LKLEKHIFFLHIIFTHFSASFFLAFRLICLQINWISFYSLYYELLHKQINLLTRSMKKSSVTTLSSFVTVGFLFVAPTISSILVVAAPLPNGCFSVAAAVFDQSVTVVFGYVKSVTVNFTSSGCRHQQ